MKPEGLQALAELHDRMYESGGIHNQQVGEAMGRVFDNLEAGESLDINFASRKNEGTYSIQVGQLQNKR